eukprot:s7039_g3.t1
MEEVISIKHDESVVENPCLDTVAQEWAARLDVSPMAACQMIVAFLQLPARPYKPQQRPPPERVSLAEEALSTDPMQAWFESRDVFACSRKVAEKRKGRQWPIFKTPSLNLLGQTAIQVVYKCVRPLREHWRRQVLQVLGECTDWTKSYQEKWAIIKSDFAVHAINLQPNGNYHLTKLGKSFFKDKWVDWVVHMPVIIRGVRRNGRNRGMPYERTKRLPVTDLNVALSRQSEGLSDAQAARNLKASVLAQLGNPEPNDIMLELSDETYYEGVDLQPAGHAGRGRPGAVFGLAYK